MGSERQIRSTRAVAVTAFKFLAFAGGLILLGWIAAETDLTAVAHAVLRVGWTGGAAIIVLFAIGFTADVGAWALMFGDMGASWLWMGRLWLVQMVGEAVNVLLPFGSLGGEPVKAMLLKRHYDVSYREATAYLLLIQAMNTLAEVPFVGLGLVAILRRHILSPTAETVMTVGVVWLGVFTIGIFIALHLRLLASLQQRLKAGRWGERLSQGLVVLGDIEERLYTFIRHRPAKFAGALIFAFLNWAFGAFETFLILRFLGMPVDLSDAWLLETCVVLVRNITFFVPGHLGTQDGVIVLVGGLLTGSPTAGLAVALVRRGRELLWSGIGLAIGGWFGLKPSAVDAT
ncbi:MAG: hypothetical protein EPO08_16855 [Rhodospirillaceae bacterium]|nr:MAG: hypothetical protein EPO08_16855 [Rhodospirillaceae bacterium]